MELKKTEITKLCSFYVSDWHLVTMLLPYISKKVNEEAKIATILEKDLKQNIVTLVEKLNLKNREKILSLNWNKNEEIKKTLNELEERQELIILINGSKKFIERENKKLEKYFRTHILRNRIKIINCYEITKYEGSVSQILDEHDKILNTSGEKEIFEVFEDYRKEEKKEVV